MTHKRVGEKLEERGMSKKVWNTFKLKNGASVSIPTEHGMDILFKQRQKNYKENLPKDWRENSRFTRDKPKKGLLFDNVKRRFTEPFGFMMGWDKWHEEIELLPTSSLKLNPLQRVGEKSYKEQVKTMKMINKIAAIVEKSKYKTIKRIVKRLNKMSANDLSSLERIIGK